MKSEEKHRLQENELERIGESFGKWLEAHGMKVVAAVCGVVLVLALGVYAWRTWSEKSAEGWGKLRAAVATNNPEELSRVADNATYKNTAVGAWARLHAAEIRLQRNIYQQFVDREISETELGDAKLGFEEVLNNTAAPNEVRERAFYGLASALEATSSDDKSIAEAVTIYEKLLTAFPNSIYKPIVERRIADLKSDEGKRFYAFFAAQQPVEEDPLDTPNDGLGGTGNPLDIPSDLELRDPVDKTPVDSTPGDDAPAEDRPALGTPGTTTPKGDDSPTGDEPKGDEKATDPKPAPADTKPIPDDDKPAPADESPKPDDVKPDDAKPIPDETQTDSSDAGTEASAPEDSEPQPESSDADTP